MRDLGEAAIATARALGAQQVAVSAALERETDVQWRDGGIEKLLQATSRSLSLDLYVDGRYASVATSDLRPTAVQRFVADAVALTRTLAPDPCRRLPEPELWPQGPAVDLGLEDPTCDARTARQRRDDAEALEAAARAVPGAARILAVTATVSDSAHASWRLHSDGFAGHRRSTAFWLACEVSVQDPDGRRPEESHAVAHRLQERLPAAAAVGALAAGRALARIGSRKGTSEVLTVVVDPRAAGRCVGILLGALSAAALQQKRSFLDGRTGQVVGSPLLHVADDPLVVHGLGSRHFDGEGLAARRLPLFEAGVLRSWYVDTYYGRKLDLAPTTGRASNLAWRLGTDDCTALTRNVAEGVLVTSFLGGNANATTGDFSLGIQGFRIRAGALAEPVAEMNVAGNQLELWPRLAAVGSDPYPYSALRTPTLVFDAVAVAGV
ncbi:MAG: TldD/PmbA family protein [Myxococcales bacterium]|nr:TldD/PmbA family protein [Myxococcales bacterium]